MVTSYFHTKGERESRRLHTEKVDMLPCCRSNLGEYVHGPVVDHHIIGGLQDKSIGAKQLVYPGEFVLRTDGMQHPAVGHTRGDH